MFRWFLSIVIALFLMTSFQTRAQGESIEDIKKTIHSNKRDTNEVIARCKLFLQLFRTDIEEAQKYLDGGMKLARELNYDRGIARCYHRYSVMHMSFGDFDQSLEMVGKSREVFSKIGDRKGISICDNLESNIHLNMGAYQKALKLCLKSEKYHEERKDTADIKLLAAAKYTIHTIHRKLEDYDKASVYLNESIDIFESLSDSVHLLTAYNALGALLSKQEKYKEAIPVLRNALGLAGKFKNYDEQGLIYKNIGVQYDYLKQFDSSQIYFYKALANFKRLNLNDKIASLYTNLGYLEVSKKNGRQAKVYFDSSLVLAKELDLTPTILLIYRGLSESHTLMNDHVSALDWYKKHHLLKDSLGGERVKNNINELNVKYEAGKKDLKIAALEKSRLEANVKEEKDRQMMIIIIASSLLLIVLLFLWLSRRNARVRERANTLEQKVFRAQMNPHFIFNSLNSIQRMYVEGNEDQANDYMADFSRLLRSILENSGKNRITLQEELDLTKNYLELEKLRTRHLFTYTIETSDDIDPLLTKVPPLIFQPYIENAIWHGILPKNEKGHISLNVSKDGNDRLKCTVTDDGVGFNIKKKAPVTEGKTSQGMAITAERLGGEQNVEINSPSGGGTRVTLCVAR